MLSSMHRAEKPWSLFAESIFTLEVSDSFFDCTICWPAVESRPTNQSTSTPTAVDVWQPADVLLQSATDTP